MFGKIIAHIFHTVLNIRVLSKILVTKIIHLFYFGLGKVEKLCIRNLPPGVDIGLTQHDIIPRSHLSYYE
jgi:hypothetical protein